MARKIKTFNSPDEITLGMFVKKVHFQAFKRTIDIVSEDLIFFVQTKKESSISGPSLIDIKNDPTNIFTTSINGQHYSGFRKLNRVEKSLVKKALTSGIKSLLEKS
jgi:hypothetical protein